MIPRPGTRINHPPHYETGRFECIEVMQEVMGIEAVKHFCICNAFKYIYRCNSKHDSPSGRFEKSQVVYREVFRVGRVRK